MGSEIEDGFHELLQDKTGRDLIINTSSKGEDESNFQSGDVNSLHCHAINKKDTGREMGLSQKKEELLMLILFYYSYFLFIYVFIFGCVGSSLLCAGFL